MSMSTTPPHIAILGAGPTGIEAALAAAESGHPFTLYEEAPAAAGSLRRWGHVRMFTPWEMSVSPRVRRRLEAAGVAVPDGSGCPTGAELADLLARAAALPEIAPHVRYNTRAVAIGREGLLKHEEIATAERARRPFRLLLEGCGGQETIERAQVLIDTTGTYGHPNSLGDGGIPAAGERSFDSVIRREIPDFVHETADWADATVLLAGAGHSAQTAVRALAEIARQAPRTRVIWALRHGQPSWGTHPGDPLPERARLAAAAEELSRGASPAIEVRRGMVVEEISQPDGQLRVALRGGSGREELLVDRILSLTGYVGDAQLYRQLQVHECYATCGPMKLSAALLGAVGGDCLAQTTHGVDTLTNPEPGLFILGSKSYGRNNSFLLRVGWEQVGELFGQLAGSARPLE
jgi:hypothetical protein